MLQMARGAEFSHRVLNRAGRNDHDSFKPPYHSRDCLPSEVSDVIFRVSYPITRRYHSRYTKRRRCPFVPLTRLLRENRNPWRLYRIAPKTKHSHGSRDGPHQLRSAATRVLQLRTFSPASVAGTTTRDELIGVLYAGARGYHSLTVHHPLSLSIYHSPVKLLSTNTHIHPHSTLSESLENHKFEQPIRLRRYDVYNRAGQISSIFFRTNIMNR